MVNLEDVQLSNEVIGYVDNKAIVLDCTGELFYTRYPSEFSKIGDFIVEEDLIPIKTLSVDLQREIQLLADEVFKNKRRYENVF